MIFIALISSFSLFASQLQTYEEVGCDLVMEEIASNYISKHLHQLNHLVSKKYQNNYRLDASQISLCGVNDLDQGSYSIERFAKFCLNVLDYRRNPLSATIYLKTEGDMFCEGEKVLSFEDIWLD